MGHTNAGESGRTVPARRPSRFALLILVLAGLLVPLLVAEAALRVVAARLPGDFQTVSFLEAHPEFGRRNRPGSGWKKSAEFTSWIEINSKGLRGQEIDYAKPEGETRILVLGDSFTFAEQVNQGETFAQRLEDRLNAERGGAHRVLNAGSNGWATANELVFLAKEGVRFSPDLVVVAFYVGNDVSDNYRRVATARDAEQADLALRGVDSFEGPRRVLRRSMLYTVFESGVLAKLPWWTGDAGSDASLRRAPRNAGEAREAWDITAGLLDRARDVAESRGARFMVMLIPPADVVATGTRRSDRDDEDDQVESGLDQELPGFDDPHGTMAEIAAREGLAALDLLPSLRRQAARSRQRLYYRVNAHWTALGHQVAARELYDFIQERNLLPPRD
ncbi:MAG: hypothetical protein U0821_18515 [Chloroflexota bacterium]